MKLLVLLSVLVTIAFSPAAAMDMSRVVLREKAFVSGEYIHLKDIAVLRGADRETLSGIPIMKTPAGSLGVTLSSAFVAGKIGEHYRKPVIMEGSSSVQVCEKFVDLSGRDLADLYRKGIMKSSPWKKVGEVVIEDVKAPAGFRVPEKYRHAVQAKFSPREDFLGFTSATLTAGLGASAVSCRVSGKVRVVASVPVARTNLTRGTVISETDLEMKRLDISTYPALAWDKKECVGMRVKGSLRAGSPLLRSNIEQPPLISRGDPVFIEARCEGLVIRDRGVALRDGFLEEQIPVKNAASGRKIFGTVIAASRIEVMF